MVSKQLDVHHSSQRDNYKTIKEISKTLESSMFSRVFIFKCSIIPENTMDSKGMPTENETWNRKRRTD